MEKGYYVVILNDGQTYSRVEGCKLLWIPEEEQDDVDNYIRVFAKRYAWQIFQEDITDE